MKRVVACLTILPVLLAAVCVATVTAQAVGGGVLYARGMLSRDKMLRYAAVLYGLDLTQIPPRREAEAEPPHELLTREQILQSRVHQNRLLQDRRTAAERGTDTIRIAFESLRADNERYEQMKTRFDAHLADIETQAREAAIQEVQLTLEVLQPKQSKDAILRMLEDRNTPRDDDVLQDVVTILKAMPSDKRKKILGEFKTEEERQRLHEILLEIGELADG